MICEAFLMNPINPVIPASPLDAGRVIPEELVKLLQLMQQMRPQFQLPNEPAPYPAVVFTTRLSNLTSQPTQKS
jgi:hypothetical protein